MISRRNLFTGALLAAPALSRAQAASRDVLRRIAALEHDHGGRLGVAVLDTAAAGPPIAYRGHERFPLCSTYKYLAAACVLARVDRRQDSLSRRMVYTVKDLVPYSPISEKHVGEPGMTLGEICEAAITLSDNTAGNLQLDSFGGPAALTAYLRTLGDPVSRLDRRETALNEATPGDPRDTTTPVAMLRIMHKTILGTALSPSSCIQLIDWLVACKTGDKRLRAGVPTGWRVGDKTGTGERNSTNDIAAIWPPQRKPIIVTAYYTGSRASDDERYAVLSEIGRLASAA